MEDFSSFGEQTVEWLNWVEDHGVPALTPLGQMSPEQIQRATNEGRDKVSAAAMIEEGNNSSLRDRAGRVLDG